MNCVQTLPKSIPSLYYLTATEEGVVVQREADAEAIDLVPLCVRVVAVVLFEECPIEDREVYKRLCEFVSSFLRNRIAAACALSRLYPLSRIENSFLYVSPDRDHVTTNE